MNEFNASSNPQEFLKLIKALKNNSNWQDKLVESLIKVEKPPAPKLPKTTDNQKFKKHPHLIGSNNSLISVQNQYSDRSVALIFKKGCISESQSDENMFDEGLPLFKIAEKKGFQYSQSDELVHEPKLIPKPESSGPKKRPNKRILKLKSARKNQEDVQHTFRSIDKISFDQKLDGLLNNILINSEKIRITMDAGIVPPDGDEEWERRYSRAKEFGARFSRNYIYRLGRQFTDLENYYIKSSGRSSNRTIENIQQHLIAVHNIILNALQAYYSHMGTSLAYVAIDKLMNVYEHISKCSTIITKVICKGGKNCDKFDYITGEVYTLSQDMVNKLAKILFETPQLYCLTLSAAKSFHKGYKWESKPLHRRIPIKQVQLDSRLSMYSISTCGRSQNSVMRKKTVNNLTRDKFSHIQSRYKTAAFKHRLPTDKQSVVKVPTRSRLDKRSSCLLRNSPLLTPSKEDGIETMVEMQYKRDRNMHTLQSVSECPSKEKVGTDKHIDKLTPLIQGLCQQICPQDGKNVSQDKLEIVLKTFLGMALDGKINNNTADSSAKNGIIKPTELLEKTNFYESNENQIHTTPVSSSPSNAVDKVCNRFDKSEKDLNSFIDFIKNVRQELDASDTNEKQKKMRSCTSLMETVNCADKISEAQHKVTFSDDSKICSKKEERCKTGKKKRRQTISVTGEKNAQLICIRDEDSIIEASEEENSKNRNKAPTHSNIKCIAKVELRKHKNLNVAPDGIKIIRLPKKSLKQLQLLPNTTLYDVIKYKISFKKFSRQNPIYRKSPTIQPWEIIDLISDHLLNELLSGVVKEIEENDLLKNLYESEFH